MSVYDAIHKRHKKFVMNQQIPPIWLAIRLFGLLEGGIKNIPGIQTVP